MDQEKARIFREIYLRSCQTRRLLANRLVIRPSSISASIGELLEARLVTEKPGERKRSGRPDLVIAPRPDRLLAISVYIDAREFKAVLVDLDERILHEESRAPSPNSGQYRTSRCDSRTPPPVRWKGAAGVAIDGSKFVPSGHRQYGQTALGQRCSLAAALRPRSGLGRKKSSLPYHSEAHQ